MFAMAKEKNLFVVAMTLTPWKGFPSWTPWHQDGTELINKWLLSMPENVDVVVDIYTLLEDPKNPTATLNLQTLMQNRYLPNTMNVMATAGRLERHPEATANP